MKTIEAVALPPSEAAHLEILALASAPELQLDRMIGGPTPLDMHAKNKLKAAEFRRRKFEIIAKHGVFDEYLNPLREKEKYLASDLEEVRRDITDLEKLRAG